MAQISAKLRSVEDGGLMYWCQGCEQAHTIYHGNDRWTWNGDVERPTFSPSVLVRGRRRTAKGKADYAAWRDAGRPDPAPESFETADSICHTFITDGMVQFLSDCTHQYAGQRLPLPDLPDHLRD